MSIQRHCLYRHLRPNTSPRAPLDASGWRNSNNRSGAACSQPAEASLRVLRRKQRVDCAFINVLSVKERWKVELYTPSSFDLRVWACGLFPGSSGKVAPWIFFFPQLNHSSAFSGHFSFLYMFVFFHVTYKSPERLPEIMYLIFLNLSTNANWISADQRKWNCFKTSMTSFTWKL